MTVDTELLSWHQSTWQLLLKYIAHERVPQALIISGAKGLNKLALAQQFAYRLLCSQPQENGLYCGNCKSCLLTRANNHPDFKQIEPEEDKKNISITQIRTVVAETSLKPQFEAYRVIIITPAELMTISAFNSFLKVLEEPNERTVFVLITEKLQKIPATIRSRCQKITVSPPSHQELHNLFNESVLSKEHQTLLNLINSSIMDIGQIKDNQLLTIREECFKDLLTLSKLTHVPTNIAEKWLKYPMLELSGWLVSWISDVIRIDLNISHLKLCNQDLVSDLIKISQVFDIKDLYKLYDAVLEFRRRLDSQLNLQLALEEILIQWQTLNWRNSL